MIEREYYWITFYDSLNKEKGYNIDIPLLNTRPEEVKLKISRTLRGLKRKNSSDTIGVRWDKERNKYIVSQSRKDYTYFLGRYNSFDEAMSIYNRFCNYDYDEFLIEREKILKRKPKTSEFFGVHLCNRTNKYIAQIMLNKKCKRIGSFNDEIEAAIAYNEFILFNNLAGTLNIINAVPVFTEFNPPKY